MILADTSVWIDHLRTRDAWMAELLNGAQIVMHPFVLGELACGHLKDREQLLATLQGLPRAEVASDDEALGFIDRHQLFGKGIGYIDTHLLASVALTSNAKLWTHDKRLHATASALGCEFPVTPTH